MRNYPEGVFTAHPDIPSYSIPVGFYSPLQTVLHTRGRYPSVVPTPIRQDSIPIIKSEWVSHSIDAGKMLPIEDYEVLYALFSF